MQDSVIIESQEQQRTAVYVEPSQADSPPMRAFPLVARLVLGTVFLIAGAEKLTALDAFGHSIANYQIVPVALVNIGALLFVWAEIVIGVLLIAGAAVRGSALMAGSLLIIFLIAILSAMARGLQIDCGCFVSAQKSAVETVGWPKVFEDVALLAGAIFLLYFPRSYLTLDGLLRREGREREL
jgi:uncharacterized membrane protein YphA (DoxX/SURF4 family)